MNKWFSKRVFPRFSLFVTILLRRGKIDTKNAKCAKDTIELSNISLDLDLNKAIKLNNKPNPHTYGRTRNSKQVFISLFLLRRGWRSQASVQM